MDASRRWVISLLLPAILSACIGTTTVTTTLEFEQGSVTLASIRDAVEELKADPRLRCATYSRGDTCRYWNGRQASGTEINYGVSDDGSTHLFVRSSIGSVFPVRDERIASGAILPKDHLVVEAWMRATWGPDARLVMTASGRDVRVER